MKNHTDNENWKYTLINNRCKIEYCIDNIYRTRGYSILHLNQVYKMTIKKAIKYLTEITNHK